MKACFIFFLGVVGCCFQSWAQPTNVHSWFVTDLNGTTGNAIPFWFRSNQSGSIPLKGASASLQGGFYNGYDSTRKQGLDWSFGLNGRVNAGYKAEVLLIEAYGRVKLGLFELEAGRTKQLIGLVDTSLSSGSFTVSGNALGVPHVQLSVPSFSYLLGGHVFAFQGRIAHGWVGTTPIQDVYSNVKKAKTYLHQASLYVRLGKPNWKLQLLGGFNHNVFWGSEKQMYGNKFTLSPVKSFIYVATGKTYKDGNSIKSKLGNHLGSIDLGLNYEFQNYSLFLYRQNFYDEGGLYFLANLADGLNGVSLTKKKNESTAIGWHKLLVEVFYSKNQAGEIWSKPTKSGDENYYNNYVYAEGWSYNGIGLGNPLISTRTSTKAGMPNDPKDYFSNNRVVALHIGVEGHVKAWRVQSKLSYSHNYGTFGTSLTGHSLGRVFSPPMYGLFKKAQQFSGYVEVRRLLAKDFEITIAAALDEGQLLNRSTGVRASVIKYF
jgi:hypothetical protein